MRVRVLSPKIPGGWWTGKVVGPWIHTEVCGVSDPWICEGGPGTVSSLDFPLQGGARQGLRSQGLVEVVG